MSKNGKTPAKSIARAMHPSRERLDESTEVHGRRLHVRLVPYEVRSLRNALDDDDVVQRAAELTRQFENSLEVESVMYIVAHVPCEGEEHISLLAVERHEVPDNLQCLEDENAFLDRARVGCVDRPVRGRFDFVEVVKLDEDAVLIRDDIGSVLQEQGIVGHGCLLRRSSMDGCENATRANRIYCIIF